MWQFRNNPFVYEDELRDYINKAVGGDNQWLPWIILISCDFFICVIIEFFIYNLGRNHHGKK
jgi:hypothetical protein